MINGHAYAGGLALALAHDYWIMNYQFGSLCMSEIKHGMPLPPVVNNLCKHRMTQHYYRDVVLTAEPVGPQDGLKSKMITELVAV